MVKFKSKLKRTCVISFLALLLLVVTAHALATPNNSTRTESTQVVETNKVSAQPQSPVVEAVEKSNVEPPSIQPAPTPVDPNGCEAKGMWWRADNFECIAKPSETVATTTSATPAQTVATGSGDCSLVNGYDWPVATAMRVCMQESGGNPNNANWSDNHMSWAGCMGSFGLFQINCSRGQVYDGAQNVAIAYSMWQGSGGSFWKYWPNTCAKVGC